MADSDALCLCGHNGRAHLAGIGLCTRKPCDCTAWRGSESAPDHGDRSASTPAGPCAHCLHTAKAHYPDRDVCLDRMQAPCHKIGCGCQNWVAPKDEQVANEIVDEVLKDKAPNPLLPARIQHTHTMAEACKPRCPAYDGPPIIKTTVNLAGVADIEIPPGVMIADGLPNLPAELGDFGRWEQAVKLLGLEMNNVISLSLDTHGVKAKLRYPNGDRMPLFFEVTYPPIIHTKPKSDEGGLFNPH